VCASLSPLPCSPRARWLSRPRTTSPLMPRRPRPSCPDTRRWARSTMAWSPATWATTNTAPTATGRRLARSGWSSAGPGRSRPARWPSIGGTTARACGCRWRVAFPIRRLIRLVPVEQAAGLGVAGGQWNVTTFDPVETTVLRLEFDGQPTFSTGILEWKVLDAGGSGDVSAAGRGGRGPNRRATGEDLAEGGGQGAGPMPGPGARLKARARSPSNTPTRSRPRPPSRNRAITRSASRPATATRRRRIR
jgi:hypothetical protein